MMQGWERYSQNCHTQLIVFMYREAAAQKFCWEHAHETVNSSGVTTLAFGFNTFVS